MKRLIFLLVAGLVLTLVLTLNSCETAGRYVVQSVLEETVDTVFIHDNEGKPWQIVDSLRQEASSLQEQLDSCMGL